MIKPQPLVLAALALLCAPAWAQVYRCPDASGRTVIQQTPCAGSGDLVGVDMKKREAAQRAQKQADQERFEREEAEREKMRADLQHSERRRQQRLKAAGVDCPAEMPFEPAVGMKEVAFLDCTHLGRLGHESVNETKTAAGTLRQYVFKPDHASSVRYVYTRNGEVTAIQR